MRGLASIGVFEETSEGRFANTDVSEYMRSDVTPSLRDLILFLNDDPVLRAWQHLPTVLPIGCAGICRGKRGGVFRLYRSRPPTQCDRGQGHGRHLRARRPQNCEGYPFGRFNTLIDIGGGQGHIIAEILQQHPALQGALLDLPPTAELARHFLAGQGLSHSLRRVRGGFFYCGSGGL